MHTVRTLAFIIILFIYATSFSQSVVINEFMSSNRSTIADENGDYEDWIELYNPTNDSINLEGWGLSDNESKPYKWIFPDITIAPEEYLLVWASGKDKTPAKAEEVTGVLHERYDDIGNGNLDDFIRNSLYPHLPTHTNIINNYF